MKSSFRSETTTVKMSDNNKLQEVLDKFKKTDKDGYQVIANEIETLRHEIVLYRKVREVLSAQNQELCDLFMSERNASSQAKDQLLELKNQKNQRGTPRRTR